MNAFAFAVVQLLHTVINVYIWIIIISAILSFIRPNPVSYTHLTLPTICSV